MTNLFIRKVNAMELTVLGRCGPFPAPGEACSGYLLKCGGKNIMLDFGSGVFSRLYGLLPQLEVDAVVLSHLHSDHMADMRLPYAGGLGIHAVPIRIRGAEHRRKAERQG